MSLFQRLDILQGYNTIINLLQYVFDASRGPGQIRVMSLSLQINTFFEKNILT